MNVLVHVNVPEYHLDPGGDVRGGKMSPASRLMASAKKAVLDLVKGLPEDATLEDIQYQLYVRQKIERSLQAAAEGRVKTHDQVKQRLAKWLAK